MTVLTTIQKELKAPKGQRNKFGNYNYRSAEDILEAAKPLLAKHDSQLTLTDEPIMQGEWHYIKATATLITKDGETTVNAYARESPVKKGMDDSQITGTASSYARKYALNGLFLIDDTKDADTDEYQEQQNKTKTATRSQSKPQTSKQSGAQALEIKKTTLSNEAKAIAKSMNASEAIVLQDLAERAKVKDIAKRWGSGLTLAEVTKMLTEVPKLKKEMEEQPNDQ